MISGDDSVALPVNFSILGHATSHELFVKPAESKADNLSETRVILV